MQSRQVDANSLVDTPSFSCFTNLDHLVIAMASSKLDRSNHNNHSPSIQYCDRGSLTFATVQLDFASVGQRSLSWHRLPSTRRDLPGKVRALSAAVGVPCLRSKRYDPSGSLLISEGPGCSPTMMRNSARAIAQFGQVGRKRHPGVVYVARENRSPCRSPENRSMSPSSHFLKRRILRPHPLRCSLQHALDFQYSFCRRASPLRHH